MNYLFSFLNGLWKFTILGILFIGSFALLALLLSTFLSGQNLIVWGLILLPYGWVMNRFILSPVEYYLDYKTPQYDPWYESRMNQKGRARSSSQTR